MEKLTPEKRKELLADCDKHISEFRKMWAELLEKEKQFPPTHPKAPEFTRFKIKWYDENQKDIHTYQQRKNIIEKENRDPSKFECSYMYDKKIALDKSIYTFLHNKPSKEYEIIQLFKTGEWRQAQIATKLSCARVYVSTITKQYKQRLKAENEQKKISNKT